MTEKAEKFVVLEMTGQVHFRVYSDGTVSNGYKLDEPSMKLLREAKLGEEFHVREGLLRRRSPTEVRGLVCIRELESLKVESPKAEKRRPPIKIGDVVRRGPTWKWGGQDCFEGKPDTGRVTNASERGDGWVAVEWKNGEKNAYRYFGDFSDIKLVPETEPAEAEPAEATLELSEGERLAAFFARSEHEGKEAVRGEKEAEELKFEGAKSDARTDDFLATYYFCKKREGVAAVVASFRDDWDNLPDAD